jgi:hypothetical protein
VVALQDEEGATWVYALPITHALPADAGNAIEIPAVVKARLGLDGERSWVVVDEANVFAWPGPDLRMLPGQGAESSAYGFLPPGFFRVVRDRFLAADSRKKAALVNGRSRMDDAAIPQRNNGLDTRDRRRAARRGRHGQADHTQVR